MKSHAYLVVRVLHGRLEIIIGDDSREAATVAAQRLVSMAAVHPDIVTSGERILVMRKVWDSGDLS